ncbi:MAG: signal peptidase I [Clostridia bacterium]|nr:signal peptidase I [Clostridia bacterium]
MEDKKKTIRSIIIIFLVCLLVAGGAFWFSRTFLIVFPIEGQSMENTLHNKDKVILFKTQNVDYGDIVIFIKPGWEAPDTHKFYVKRVIGLPGDHIEIKYDLDDTLFHVYRNGTKLDESYIKEKVNAYNEVDVVIPDGKFFFLGDNRMNSNDSHTQGGTFLGTLSDIQGKAFVRYSGWTDISFL